MKIAFPLVLFLAVFQSASAVRGAPSAKPGRALKKASKAPEARDCEIKEEEDKVKSECKAKTEQADGTELEDEIEFEVKTTTRGVKIKVEYKQEIEDGNTETESETQFEVYFDSIIEYIKTSANASDTAYNWETDETVQTMELDTWQDISPVETDDEGVTSTFSVTNPAGNVTFFFTISRAAQNEQITANSIKIDFSLDNFPWKREDSYVALLSTVETKREIEVEYDEGDDEAVNEATARKANDILVNFDGFVDEETITPIGEYKWAETAEATSKTAAINATDTNSTDVLIETQSVGDEEATVSRIRVVATSPLVEPEDRLRRALAEDHEDHDHEEGEDHDHDHEDGEDHVHEDDHEDDEKEKTESEVESKTTRVQSIAFSFVGDAAHTAEHIFWDPQAGVSYTEAASGSGSSVVGLSTVFGLVSAILALAATY